MAPNYSQRASVDFVSWPMSVDYARHLFIFLIKGVEGGRFRIRLFE